MRGLAKFTDRFRRNEDGAVLAEALIVVPFVTLFSVGILEFGNMFWQKQNIETGLRDAARFIARCQQVSTATFTAGCRVAGETVAGETVARRIAYFGSADATATEGRVSGWNSSTGPITLPSITRDGETIIRAETSYIYQASPLFGWLGLDDITINAYHEERYIGW
jgi:hypothetical protein